MLSRCWIKSNALCAYWSLKTHIRIPQKWHRVLSWNFLGMLQPSGYNMPKPLSNIEGDVILTCIWIIKRVNYQKGKTRTMKLYLNILTLVQEAWKTGYILIVLTNKNKLGIKNEQILIIIKEISGKTSDIKSHNKIETIRIEFL